MSWRWLGVTILVALLSPPSLAQDQAGPFTGPFPLDDVLTVDPGTTLTFGPGAQVIGAGRIEVWGNLVIAGDPARRAEVSVPILLLGNGTSRFEHARLWGVHGAAVTMTNGTLDAHDTVFEANAEGLVVDGDAVATLRDITFSQNAGAALRINGSSEVTLSRGLLEGNGRGIEVSSGRLTVQDSTFHGDTTQFEITWSGAPLAATVARNDIWGAHATAGPLVVVRASVAPNAPILRFTGNHIHGAAIGVLAIGPGPVFESRNDTIDANVVGLSLHAGAARLVGTALGNDRDLEGVDSGDVSLDNVTYLRTSVATIPVIASPVAPWGAIGLGLAGVAIVGLLVAQPLARRRMAQAPPPAIEAPVIVPTPLAQPVLTAQELRILRDIAANPGSAQAAIAQRLGMTRQALHYHVKKLEARSLIVKEARGRETLCTVPPAVAASLPSVPAPTDTHLDEKG